MGSWNATCMISNLPIHYGDEVVCFLIAQNYWRPVSQMASDYCYIYDQFMPVGFPFVAKYDDYGYIENIVENRFTDWNLMFLKTFIVERDQGENEFHDHKVKRNLLTWETLGTWMHGKRVLLKNPFFGATTGPEDLSVGMAMVHKFVWDKLKAYVPEFEQYLIDVKSKNLDNFFEIIKDALHVYATARKTDDDDDAFADNFMKSWKADESIRRFTQNRLGCDLKHLEIPPAEIPQTAQLVDDWMRFEGSMTLLRKSYGPACGAGSQSQEYGLYLTLMEAMGDHINKMQKENEE